MRLKTTFIVLLTAGLATTALAQSKEEIKTWKKKQKALEPMEFKALVEGKDSLQTQLTETMSQLDQEITAYEAQIKSLQAQLAEKEAQLAKLQGTNATLSEELSKGAAPKTDGFKLRTESDSLSYAIGVNVSQTIRQSGLSDINEVAVYQGFLHQGQGKGLLISEQQAGQVIQQGMAEAQRQQAEKQGGAAKEAGEEFLRQNRRQPGVKVTPSGLQYKVVKEGSAKKPTAASTVEVHYHGTLIDGTVFDSSVQRGETISFPLNGVIPGWTEGLQLIGEGGKIMLYIPYNLAYGERGAGASIPPYSTLIFEVELFKIK